MELVEAIAPDLVIMNLDWPDKGESIAACRQIRKSFESTRVLAYSARTDDQLPLLSLLAGASGYLSWENMTGDGILKAVEALSEGGMYFDWSAVHRVAGRLINDVEYDTYSGIIPSILTNREWRVLQLVGEGLSNGEIARKVSIAPTTVRNYIIGIRTKLGLESRYKLISYAARHGILAEGKSRH